jgi:hypothetical protein
MPPKQPAKSEFITGELQVLLTDCLSTADCSVICKSDLWYFWLKNHETDEAVLSVFRKYQAKGQVTPWAVIRDELMEVGSNVARPYAARS